MSSQLRRTARGLFVKTFLPAFQRSFLAGLVLLAVLVAGVEVVRRFVLSDTAERLLPLMLTVVRWPVERARGRQ
ncbi:MAG: hypothetical protein H0U05_11495, partial [Actinobacteria bacterium]|nr:hypothetical protein [Actinomycetota bacterium]